MVQTSEQPEVGKQAALTPAVNEEASTDDYWDDTADDSYGLLRRKRKRRYEDFPRDSWTSRPYWLGMGLFLVLLSFWVLDSLKDNVLGMLTNGNLEEHQPPAKLFSVFTTLALVLLLEYTSNERRKNSFVRTRSKEDVLAEGGTWETIQFHESPETPPENSDGVTSAIFTHIGVPYCLVFGIMAYVLQFNANLATSERTETTSTAWTLMGYAFYAAIESFGSIAVATFWSFANSTLSLSEAEKYYGTIIAIAQLGAILGSTMVTMHVWNTITLIILACLVILLHILVMLRYCSRFPINTDSESETHEQQNRPVDEGLISGVHLILKHNYVLLILGVSCLYEISLTCLNYQMTLLGWNKFEESGEASLITFAQFMGHYGQMVNISSLILSSFLFPFLIRRIGLRWTLRGFPTLLLLVNIMAFGILPGNLAVLFFSLSFLKAMTYSIHDPSKELLYLPTSNQIKFKAKFWIDVVGARIAKAVGSSINNFAGDVDRSIRISSTPSLLTALGLVYVCYKVGILFENLVETDTVVGVSDDKDRQLLYETPEDDGYINDAGPNDTEDDGSFGDPERIR